MQAGIMQSLVIAGLDPAIQFLGLFDAVSGIGVVCIGQSILAIYVV